MQTWRDILATAVVGSEQQELVLMPQNDELGRVISQIGGVDREGLLLNAASLVALYRRAGLVPATDTKESFEVCETDETIRASMEAGQHLALMLEGEFQGVLPEWLRAIAMVGARVPEEYLPALLDEGRAKPSLRELIIAVIGKRGEWLAAQNPDWNYATPRDGKEVWETGTRDERLLLLDNLRTRDSNAAREVLAGTWQQESAKDRAAFLEKLAVGVSDDDEAFLNEALHDRSGDVRRVAREILARLPNAQFTRRMKELTAQVLTFKKPILGKARIEGSLPDDPLGWLKTNEVEIDSPPRSSAAQSLGPKGWCLKEMVALTPVNHWAELWQKSPSEIVSAAFEGEWVTALSDGFLRAVRRDRDPDWIEALIRHWLNDAKPQVTYSSPVDLSVYLPIDRLEALILTLMKSVSKGLNDTHPVLHFLLVHPGQWSDQLSRLVVDSIKIRIPRIRKDERIDWQTRAALKKFAHHVSPALYDELAHGWPMESEGWAAWSQAVDEFQSLLAFRRDMHNTISKKERNS